jgi:hypothetical protein
MDLLVWWRSPQRLPTITDHLTTNIILPTHFNTFTGIPYAFQPSSGHPQWRTLVLKWILRKLSICLGHLTRRQDKALHKESQQLLWRCGNTTLRDQNSMLEEIKSRLNSGNACYHAVQSLLTSRLLSRTVKVDICKSIILTVVLYGCQTLFLVFKNENRIRVFERRV